MPAALRTRPLRARLESAVVRARIGFALIACALLVAGLGWWAFEFEPAPIQVPSHSASDGPALPIPQPTPTEQIVEPSEAEVSLEDEPAVPHAETTRREPAAVDGAEDRHCTLVGRVVDGEGNALAGVSVTFRTYGSWSEVPEAIGVPWIVDEEYRGLATSTTATGEFRVEAPVPTAEVVELRVELDAFHTTEELHYGGRGGRARRAIAPGTNDLGTFTLPSAGSVSGRVVSESGFAIAGAKVFLSSPIAVECETDSAGRYRIEHWPPGDCGLGVDANGYLSQFQAPVTVVAGRDVARPDIVLARAPTLRGRVVDEHGQPLAGAQIRCCLSILMLDDLDAREGPRGWGEAIGTSESGSDGRFVLHLPYDRDHRVEVTLSGHDPFTAPKYAPGTEGIEVVLPTAAEVALRVVDRETKEPVELFDTHVVRKDFVQTPWLPHYTTHPDGRVQIEARPDVDRIRIAAPGYREDEVAAKAGAKTIRLRRGPELLGRLVSNGLPVPHPSVLVERRASASFDFDSFDRNRPWEGDVDTRSSHRGEADGTFRIGLSRDGDYRLEIYGSSSMPLVLAPVDVPREGTLDLGDLELPRGAAIDGRIELPPGVPLGGFAIHVPAISRDEPLTYTDGGGGFRLENLPPGDCGIAVNKEGVLEERTSPERLVRLVDGERQTVVIAVDPERLLVRVTVTISSHGVPRPDIAVRFESYYQDDEWFDETDSRGVARGTARIGTKTRLVLTAPAGIQFVPDVEPIVLEFGSPREITVELDTGQLELAWPKAPETVPSNARSRQLALVEHHNLGIGLSRDGDAEQVHWMSRGFARTRASDGLEVLELDLIEPGGYVVRMMEATHADGFDADGDWDWPPPFRPQRESRAVVVAGQAATCRF